MVLHRALRVLQPSYADPTSTQIWIRAVRSLLQAWHTHLSGAIHLRASTIRSHGRTLVPHLHPPLTGDLPGYLIASPSSRNTTSPWSATHWTARARRPKPAMAANSPKTMIKPANPSSDACLIPSGMVEASVTRVCASGKTANSPAHLPMAAPLERISAALRPAPPKPRKLPGFVMSYARNVSVCRRWRPPSASLQMSSKSTPSSRRSDPPWLFSMPREKSFCGSSRS